LVWTYPTIAELARHFVDQIGEAAVGNTEPQRAGAERAPRGPTVLDRVEHLSEREVEALLKKERRTTLKVH
jgi:hypothetical protein